VQQIGRAGRDGKEAICISFFTEADKFQVRQLIEDSVIPSGAAWDIISRVVESTSPGGCTSFLGRAELSAFDLHPRQTDVLLALLCRVGVALAGEPAPGRFGVSLGEFGDAGVVQGLSVLARALWQQHLCPLFEEPRTPRRKVFGDVRVICGSAPFLGLYSVGPVAVHVALQDLASAGLVVVDNTERFPSVIPLTRMGDVDVGRAASRAARISRDDVTNKLATLDAAEKFFSLDGCVQLRLCALFGSTVEQGLVLDDCQCSHCLSDDALLRGPRP